MKVLSKLTDEYFGNTKRDEDKIVFNIPEMKLVDMGGSVLWTDDDLTIVGDLHGMYAPKVFTFNDVCNMKFENGLRLPTIEEFRELEKNKQIHRARNLNRIVYIYDNRSLTTLYFDCRTFFEDDVTGDCYRFVSDMKENNPCVVDLNKKPFIVKLISKPDSQYYNVRLVKDK